MNELTKTESTDLATFSANDFAAAGPQQNITQNDVVIPKILIMQGQSPKVLEQEAMFGELRDSLNWEKLASAKVGNKAAVPLKAIPFHWEKFWIIKVEDGKRWKTEKVIKMDRFNENDDQYEIFQGEDGKNRKRVYLHMFSVIIPGKPLPYTIGFRGSSKKSGDALVTQMYTVNSSLKTKKGEEYKASPMGKYVTITPTIQTKEDNKFTVLEVSSGPDDFVSFEEACEALKWNKLMRKGDVKTDDSDILEEGHAHKELQTDY